MKSLIKSFLVAAGSLAVMVIVSLAIYFPEKYGPYGVALLFVVIWYSAHQIIKDMNP
jgi:hypothetical protein